MFHPLNVREIFSFITICDVNVDAMDDSHTVKVAKKFSQLNRRLEIIIKVAASDSATDNKTRNRFSLGKRLHKSPFLLVNITISDGMQLPACHLPKLTSSGSKFESHECLLLQCLIVMN